MWELIDYKHKKVIDKLPVQCKKKYAGFYSIRLNIAYRVVFAVQEQIKVIRILEISKHKYNY